MTFRRWGVGSACSEKENEKITGIVSLYLRKGINRQRWESSDSASTIIASKPTVEPYIVFFSSGDTIPGSDCNKVKLSQFLDTLTSGRVTEIRVD